MKRLRDHSATKLVEQKRARWSVVAGWAIAVVACGRSAGSGVAGERDADETSLHDGGGLAPDGRDARTADVAGDRRATDGAIRPDATMADTTNDVGADASTDAAVDPPSPLVGRNLVFSYAQVTSKNGATASELRLGYLAIAADGSLEAQYFSYDPGLDSPQTPTPAFHAPMDAPYGTGQCSPGPVYIASYSSFVDLPGTWSWSSALHLLTVTIGAETQSWKLEAPTPEFYRLSSISSSDPAVTYSVMLGLGYGTSYADMPDDRPIAASDLGDYSGELYSNNGGSVTSPFNESMPELNTSAFQVAPGEGDVLSDSFACPTDSEWCESSILVNYAPFSKLIVYDNGGHDFNMDGCFNEGGHAYTEYGIYDGTRIARLVFIEYSYQTAGFPIVSVGRYY